MCNHENREAEMVTVQTDQAGKPTVWCDPCLAPLVAALNDGGLRTVASCCGHGTHLGSVALADGRWIVLMDAEDWASFDSSRSGTVTDTEVRWEYGCWSSAHSGFMRSVATWDDEATWLDHLAECPSPAPVMRRVAGDWEARS